MVQRFLLTNALVYARRCPFGATAGAKADVPTPSIRRGVPPATDMRHRVVIPPRSDGKMISRESGVQAGPLGIDLLSKVCPRAWSSCDGMQYRWSTTAGREGRREAMGRPSGGTSGAQSEYGSGGVVR